MKNKHIEQFIKSSKRRAKRQNPQFYNAQYNMWVYHYYQDENGNRYKDRAYWDDVKIKVGSHNVVILFTHPRYDYTDHCRFAAYNEADKKLSPPDPNKAFEPTQTNFKKVGKSRKKAVSYLMGNIGTEGKEYYDFVREQEQFNLKNTDFVAKCHFKVKQEIYCRQVQIQIPLEVVDEDSLYELTNIVRFFLKNPEEFDKRYGDYTYGKDDYLKENVCDSA